MVAKDDDANLSADERRREVISGGNVERPGLKSLMTDIEAGKIDCVVVYKVDRLSRSLMDFARLMEVFDRHKVSFVSVTQHFNTTHSMGRLTLNILLSFAQFEREIIGERIRDKIAAAKKRGKWGGGPPPFGYDVDRSNGSPRLVVNPAEAYHTEARAEIPLLIAAAGTHRASSCTRAIGHAAGLATGTYGFDLAIKPVIEIDRLLDYRASKRDRETAAQTLKIMGATIRRREDND